MSFIINQSGGLIVQRDFVTILEKIDAIYTTLFVREIISCIEEENELAYEKENDCEFQIEYNQVEPLKEKLEPIITNLKLDGTIGDNFVKNIHRTKKECVLQILNHDIRLTC